MRILWLKTGPLFPLDSGGKKRTHAMLEELSKRHEVTYVALLAAGQSLHPDEESATYAKHKVWLPWRETPKRSWRFAVDLLRNYLLSSLPYALEKYVSKPMRDWLQKNLQMDHGAAAYDLVLCDFLFPATNLTGIKTQTPRILFQHNMEAVIWKRLAESQTNSLKRYYLGVQFKRFDRWERELSKGFDGIVTVSEEDSLYATGHYRLGNVRGHVATGVDAHHFAPRKVIGSNDQAIGFLGSMDWMPNIQAVTYFADQIYPKIKEAEPSVRFVVIGRNPPKSIRELADRDDSITVTGSVDDVAPHLKACDLMVVPLLAGGGTRIKILEAMAMGVPVVSTTIGAEGLELEGGRHLEIVDDADAFADLTVELLSDRSRRISLADAAHERLLEKNGWNIVVDEFLKLCAGQPES